ncbi:NAD-dependent DNA ligase LigA [Patescibacteria group bacterium]|nr:NAD-dependent DNA ligase LigA [Patescibacteria group bacterium]
MNKAQAKDRITKLKDLINDYRYHYHVLDESIMDDAAADSLKYELAQLEFQFPDLVTPDSPTQRVAGGVLPGFKKVEHQRRMLSLNDVFSQEEVAAWISRIQKAMPDERLTYFADIKMDGLACALIYEDGLLTKGVTRGDGFVGEDVTANIRTIESIPLALRQHTKYPLFLKGVSEIRGEIVMYKHDFEQLNTERQKQGQTPFANPRNTAAGTIRQLDPNLVAERPLHFRAYDFLRLNAEEVPTNDYVYKVLPDLGFSVNKAATVLHSLEEIMGFVHLWQDKRQQLEFNTDGIVIKINDRRLFDRLGVAGKAPRAAIAFKYAAEQSTTKVKDIFVSIGRTGNATPVAVLEPVLIAGSVVQMATLHNESEVQRKDVRIGDTVIVHKAGDIIPEVVQSLPSLRTGKERIFKMPAYCPVCGTKLVKQKAEDAAWRCPNPSCPSRTWKQIQHFASKEALDIEGLGEKTVIALLDAGLIKDTADIYKLTPDKLIGLERFAGVSANKLYSAIQAKKYPPINRFVYGLGIRHIGVQTAIDLTKKFKSLEGLMNAKIDELAAVEGVGEIVAEAVVEYFAEPRSQRLLAKFKSLGVWPEPAQTTGGKLEGKNLVVTGTLNSMSREEAADKIRSLGGRFQTSVAKDTDYLVVGNAPGASKITKARQLGTQIIDESTLLSLLD